MRLLAPLLLALALAAPAAAEQVPPPAGQGPLRFRDEVFGHIAVDRGLRYGPAAPLLLDLYRPRGDRRSRRPAMVWVHGGGFAGGTRTHRTLRSLALGSARRGYVSIAIDYRILSPSGCAVSDPACLSVAIEDQHDVQAAVRWLRRNAARYRVDPARIAVGGTSVGGILSYLVGTRPDDPGESGNAGWSSRVRAFVSIAGGFPGPDGGGYPSAGDAPGLLFHGTHDRTTPFSWSIDATRALRAAGVPATLQLIPRGQHVAYEVYRRRYDQQTANFLYRALDLG
ncbi:MAG: symbB [Solirubrobacterales bacterium]|nr:symbB [Solirubrobacterales bacterium]